MKLFDTHFHLEPEDDLADMVARAESANVGWMLLAGAGVAALPTALARIAPYPNVFAAAGVHPHAAAVWDGELGPYREYAAQPQVKAIGEIGLDYYYDFCPKERQRQVLGSFLDLAAETGLPAILHCREAEEDCLALLRDRLPAGHPHVIHCFTGTPEWATTFLAAGAHLSFTGILTFGKADNVRAALRVVPRDRLMFETDSPYLAPKPHRGKRNQPAFVADVVKGAAAVLDMDLETLIEESTRNALRFFRIEQPTR